MWSKLIYAGNAYEQHKNAIEMDVMYMYGINDETKSRRKNNELRGEIIMNNKIKIVNNNSKQQQ